MSRKIENSLVALAAVGLTLSLTALLAVAQALSPALAVAEPSRQGQAGPHIVDTSATPCLPDPSEPDVKAAEAAPVRAGLALPSLTMPYFSFAPLLPRGS